jgi:hypothetical protein
MKEIIVKAYWLFKVKKKTYIKIQIIGFIFWILFFISTFFHKYALWKILWIDDKIIILIILILEIIETYFILKKFKEKELLLKKV